MFRDVAPRPRTGGVQSARKLRGNLSLPEIALWRHLRTRPGGLKFRRQHPSGPYVLDFYCSDARLGIEIDGEAHDRGKQPRKDVERDRWFADHGIATLRIPAAEVLADLGAVLIHVVTECRARLPLHHPAAPGGPPPRDELGED